MPSKSILITGVQRSGTTWLGKILASDGKTKYIHEPFNPVNKFIHNSPITIPYQYINEDIANEAKQFLEYFMNPGIRFFLNSIFRLNHANSRYLIPGVQNLRNLLNKGNVVIKDPHALLSCEWLYRELNWKIVVVLRHPAAFALSMKEKNWIVSPFVFRARKNILNKDWTQLEPDLKSYLKTKDKRKDLIQSSIYGWNIMYKIIDWYRKNYPEWIFVKHEDLSKDPLNTYQVLFDNLGLEMNKKVINKIKQTTQGKSVTGQSRDATSNIQKWRNDLSKEEIERIRIGTQEVFPLFYNEEDW